MNEINLQDIAQNIICSSFNINNTDLTNVSKNIYKTASYMIVSINKPAFFIELQEKLNGN
jgi:hypothetical protein